MGQEFAGFSGERASLPVRKIRASASIDEAHHGIPPSCGVRIEALKPWQGLFENAQVVARVLCLAVLVNASGLHRRAQRASAKVVELRFFAGLKSELQEE